MTKSTYLSVTSGLALGVLAIATVASADAHKTYGHGTRGHRGFSSEAITNSERKIIARDRRRVIQVRQQALRDGYVTRREAKKVNRVKRKLHRHVYWARSNDTVRPYSWDDQRRRDAGYDHGRHGSDRARRWWW